MVMVTVPNRFYYFWPFYTELGFYGRVYLLIDIDVALLAIGFLYSGSEAAQNVTVKL